MVTGRTADEIDGLRRALGSSELERIAPHCTLVPPVNVTEADVGLAFALVREAAAKAGPITVSLGPPATFYPPNPVCYLKVSGDLDEVSSLRDRLQQAPLTSGARRERRPFVPHVTVRQKMPPDRIARTLDAISHFEVSHCFQSVTLIEFDQVSRRWVLLADARLGPPHIAGRGGLEIELHVSGRLDPETEAWVSHQWAQYRRAQHGTSATEDEDYAVTARVRSEGAVAGVAEGQLRPPVCHLARLVVAPEWRSYGIGSQLLRSVDGVAAQHRCGRVRVETLAGGMAERFYRERGYAVVARLPGWRHERDFVMMERPISE